LKIEVSSNDLLMSVSINKSGRIEGLREYTGKSAILIIPDTKVDSGTKYLQGFFRLMEKRLNKNISEFEKDLFHFDYEGTALYVRVAEVFRNESIITIEKKKIDLTILDSPGFLLVVLLFPRKFFLSIPMEKIRHLIDEERVQLKIIDVNGDNPIITPLKSISMKKTESIKLESKKPWSELIVLIK